MAVCYTSKNILEISRAVMGNLRDIMIFQWETHRRTRLADFLSPRRLKRGRARARDTRHKFAKLSFRVKQHVTTIARCTLRKACARLLALPSHYQSTDCRRRRRRAAAAEEEEHRW